MLKLLPRYMTGVCTLRFRQRGGYKLKHVTGKIIINPGDNTYLAETRFFNLFGFVLFPEILSIYKPT